MSHKPHPIRSSRSSHRNSPYSRPPSSSPLPSSQQQPTSYDFTPHQHVDDQLPAPTSDCQPIPVISTHFPANSISTPPFRSSQQYAHPREQNYSSAPPVPFSPPQLSQEPISTIQGPSRPHYPARGSFSDAHNFTMNYPMFIDNNVPADNFMEKLLQHTIIGAEFDSSARDPPPRCHPGTRLKIIERCINFILECHGEEKLRWVVGPAGVGKSAVMQIVVEKAHKDFICASVFLSVNGRQDGSKTILTIAYQLAVKCGPYRQFIQDEISLDPSLLQKSLSVQFDKFIAEPFIHRRLFDSSRRFLIVIDGLDECDNPDTQLKLLELISNFCISCPTSSIAWIVASRPEDHITSFFDNVEVQPAYIKEEIEIDSDEACADVQRYLRTELNKIKLAKPSLRRRREWPSEIEFTTIASAAGGLFAYAAVVVRYINDSRYRDPTAQLRRVLEVIKGTPLADMSGRGHPMAQLDALYARILSTIPDDIMINVREMLFICLDDYYKMIKFRLLCNLLGLSEEAAYGATSYLHAVMRVPEAEDADVDRLEYFHKSFEDFLFDSKRSGLSHNVSDEVGRFTARTFLKLVQQVSLDTDGLPSGDGVDCSPRGVLQGGPGICDNISLSWPGDERFPKTDADLRLDLYRESMYGLCSKYFPHHRFSYRSMSCFQALTTRFVALGPLFPSGILLGSAFDKLRHELTELGKLKQVPLRTLNYFAIFGPLRLWFTLPIEVNVDLSNSWDPFCNHQKDELDNLQQCRGWMTEFQRFSAIGLDSEGSSDTLDDGPDTDIRLLRDKPCHREHTHAFVDWPCDYCSRHFFRHFISNPDLLATCFVDSTGLSYVECSFVDPDDGVSEWRYRFLHSGPPKPINT